eukprot:UN22604
MLQTVQDTLQWALNISLHDALDWQAKMISKAIDFVLSLAFLPFTITVGLYKSFESWCVSSILAFVDWIAVQMNWIYNKLTIAYVIDWELTKAKTVYEIIADISYQIIYLPYSFIIWVKNITVGHVCNACERTATFISEKVTTGFTKMVEFCYTVTKKVTWFLLSPFINLISFQYLIDFYHNEFVPWLLQIPVYRLPCELFMFVYDIVTSEIYELLWGIEQTRKKSRKRRESRCEYMSKAVKKLWRNSLNLFSYPIEDSGSELSNEYANGGGNMMFRPGTRTDTSRSETLPPNMKKDPTKLFRSDLELEENVQVLNKQEYEDAVSANNSTNNSEERPLKFGRKSMRTDPFKYGKESKSRERSHSASRKVDDRVRSGSRDVYDNADTPLDQIGTLVVKNKERLALTRRVTLMTTSIRKWKMQLPKRSLEKEEPVKK